MTTIDDTDLAGGRHALNSVPDDVQVYYGRPAPRHARPECPDPRAHYESQARQSRVARSLGLWGIATAEMGVRG